MKLLVALIFSLSTSLSWAGIEEAIAAYEREDYGTTFKILKEIPNQDDSKVQYLYGVMNFNGQGVDKNYNEAGLNFYRAAANGRIVDAMLMTGKMLILGLGTEKDYENGYKWLQEAAKEGSIEAANIIAALDREAKPQKKFKPAGKVNEPSEIELRLAFSKKISSESYSDTPHVMVISAEKIKGGCKRVNDTAFLCNVKLGTKAMGQRSKIDFIQARLEFEADGWYVAYLN